MDFSKHKLHKYLTEGQAVGTGTLPSLTASANSSVGAQNGGMRAKQQQTAGRSRQETRLSTQRPMSKMSEEYKELLKEKEAIKALESQKSDWRTELQEKVVDGQERQQHPYVTVMPTGDENLIQAIEQMAKTAKKKKDAVEEGYAPGDVDEKLGAVTSIPKKDQDDAKARLLAKAKAKREKKKEVKEEIEELEEAKKKCKEGYKYDSEKKKCVKKKKKKSSSKKSTTVIIGRPLYGGGHHHHHDDHDDDNDGDGGGGDSGGGEGGGMGEMFDMLGDMMKKELQEQSRMEKMKAEYESAAKKPSPFDKMSDKQKQQMSKATRSTRNYK